MDLGIIFLTNENIEFNGFVCDHYYKIAHSQILCIPILQSLRPSLMHFSFLWVLHYLFYEAVIYPNQNLHFFLRLGLLLYSTNKFLPYSSLYPHLSI